MHFRAYSFVDDVNLMTSPSVYYPGGVRIGLSKKQKLLVWNPAVPRVAKEAHFSEIVLRRQIHEVAYGETAIDIANQYGMTLEELRGENRCYFPKGYPGNLRPGMKLVVKKRAN